VRGARCLLLGAALAALVGCATDPPLAPARAGEVPDLRGRWSGTWAGTPATLLVLEQEDASGYRGVYVGSAVVLGERPPGLSGTLTSTVNGRPVTANARGWVGHLDGRLTLRVRAETSDGVQVLTLIPTGDQLQGSGESSFRWGPRGLVGLTREAAPPAR
jgi:hypothetical protein